MIKKQKLGPSEKVIQLYVKVSDIIRTEHREEIDSIYKNRHKTMAMPENVFSVEDLIKDIDDKGILDALKIKADGTVMRGNTRCEVADIKGIEYLPIDLGFFIGLFHGDKAHITTIRKIIYEQEIDTMNTGCRPVKPPTTEEYRKKVGRTPGDKDYLINWSDEFVLLQSHFIQKKVHEKQGD